MWCMHELFCDTRSNGHRCRAQDTFQKMKGPKAPGDELENPTAVLTGAEVCLGEVALSEWRMASARHHERT